jgi:aldehyde:ferredoxin oxidoreductase
MRPGYAGNILFVDLTRGEIVRKPLDPQWAEDFIGGWGINARLAWDVIPPRADALSAENAIIIGAGPFSGTIVPGSAELSITTRLPLSAGIGTGCGGGHFPLMLKTSGYDHVVVTGRSKTPVYLCIRSDAVELRDAGDLWGQDTVETVDTLRLRHEPCSIIPIGPAGENQVKMSVTFIDKGGTIGFGGLPAVMGAKNLKAIVACQGDRSIRVADPRLLKKTVARMMDHVLSYRLRPRLIRGGTFAMTSEWFAAMGVPIAGWDEIHEACRQTLACPSCPMGDKEVNRLRQGEFSPFTVYLTDFMGEIESSARTPLDNHNRAVKRADLLNRMGICKLSFHNVMDLMLTLYEKGIITKEDTGGIEISRDFDTVLRLIHRVARREGFGDVLAEGPRGAAQRIGPAAEKHALHIKGCALFIDPRPDSMNTMAFAQMVHPGRANYACGGIGIYMQGRPVEQFVHHARRTGIAEGDVPRIFTQDTFNVPRLTRHAEDWYSLFNAFGQCHRLYIHRFQSMSYFLEFLKAVTGQELSASDLLRRGERIWNLQKLLNVRVGLGRSDDRAPEKWFEPKKIGDREFPLMDYYRKTRISREDTERMLSEYYEARGWDKETGVPTSAKLKELRLEDFRVS